MPMIDPNKIPKLYFYRWLLYWFQPIFKRWFKLRAEGFEIVPKEGPYLIISNHSHKLDQFFINVIIRRPIFNPGSNEDFRNPFKNLFMWAMSGFSRWREFLSPSLRSVRYMRNSIKLGHPLAIYPEGRRNWDGETRHIFLSTAKLIRLLKVPVVAVLSKGNYLAWPRWANKPRKCPITLHFAKPITIDQKNTYEEIIDWIQKAIYNNEKYTKIGKIRGKRPAEGLTRLLWRCPICRKIEGLTEISGKILSCTQCNKEWEVNLYCYMREIGKNSWKPIKEYADLMFKEEEIVPIEHSFVDYLENDEQVFLLSDVISLFREPIYPYHKLKKIDEGNLLLTDKGLLFIKKNDGHSIRYAFDTISWRSTINNFIFLIEYEYYRTFESENTHKDFARFEMLNESCLKWEPFYDFVRNMWMLKGRSM